MSIFLAHSSLELDVERVLGWETFFKNAGLSTFLKERNCHYMEDLETSMAIATCKCFVAIVTENFMKCSDCAKEVSAAKRCNKRLVPIFLEECEQYDIPKMFGSGMIRYYVDARNMKEKLIYDVKLHLGLYVDPSKAPLMIYPKNLIKKKDGDSDNDKNKNKKDDDTDDNDAAGGKEIARNRGTKRKPDVSTEAGPCNKKENISD